MSGIFISYRRQQAGGYAGRLTDELARRFGKHQVFRDIEAISAGSDFVQAIDTAIATCDALIVMITPGWADAVDEEGNRRLENPEDFVRLEIESALRRDVWVIPVLVGGAAMPASHRLPEEIRSLARRQAHEIRDASWDYNVDQLVSTLERKGVKSITPVEPAADRAQAAPAPAPKRGRIGKLAAVMGGVLAVFLVLVIATSALRDQESAVPIQAERAAEDAKFEQSRTPAAAEARRARPEPVPSAEAEERAAERMRREVADAVARASEAEIAAFRTMDATPLYGSYDGMILDQLLGAMEELRSEGFYSVNTLHGRDIHSISIAPDGQTAVVEMTERWSTEYWNDVVGACLRVAEHDAPQTLHLYRSPDGWRVQSIEHYGQAPQPVRC